MQDLNEDGVPLKSLNILGAALPNIELNNADLSGCILNKVNRSD